MLTYAWEYSLSPFDKPENLIIHEPVNEVHKRIHERRRRSHEWRIISARLNTILGEGNDNPLQYLEHPMDGGAWWAAVHGVAKSWTWLSDFTFTSHFHALEKEMTTHSNILAWRIPVTGEPAGLPSMGSHRVRHDWSILAAAAANTTLALYPKARIKQSFQEIYISEQNS